MSAILIVYKVEFSDADGSSKYDRTDKLMLICSVVAKKAITMDSKCSYCLST